MKNNTIAEADKNEKDNKIPPLKNLKGKPVFIFGDQLDKVVPPQNQLLEAEFLHHYEANIDYFIGMNESHGLPPSVIRKGM